MARRSIGIVMNGVTGRMGYRQHLVRSILALREQDDLALADGTIIWPEPVLVGRNAEKLKNIAERHQLENWTTDLDSALADPVNEVYFDAQSTQLRAAAVRQALVTGMHVYVEKPVAASLPEALELARLAREAGLKNGVVQDKLFLAHVVSDAPFPYDLLAGARGVQLAELGLASSRGGLRMTVTKLRV